MIRVRRTGAAGLAAMCLILAAPASAQHEGHAMLADEPAPTDLHAADQPAPAMGDAADPHAHHRMAPAAHSSPDPHAAHRAAQSTTDPARAADMPADPHAHHRPEPDAGTNDPHRDHGVLPDAPAPPTAMTGTDPHAGHGSARPAPAGADPHAHHGGMDMRPAPTIETPPPPGAGSGPPRAADAIWGAEAMRASRDANRREMGAMRWGTLMADRLEYRAGDGADIGLWDMQASIGGDIDRLWLKSEGEVEWGRAVHDAEAQALWSHAIAPFFDLQLGVRQDLAGPARTHAVIGIQGLMPYQFELDAAAFLSHKGDLTARIEAELDQRITRRLILQPRAEIALSAQHIPELGIGAGLDKATLGLRLRYEIVRTFAPYIGIEQSWRAGRSARYARAAGEDPGATQFVIGLRVWF